VVDGVATDATFQHQVGYAQQQDIHLSTMAVRETLESSAILRQPSEVPCKDKLQYVNHVINILEMQEFIGDVIGCSRRVSQYRAAKTPHHRCGTSCSTATASIFGRANIGARFAGIMSHLRTHKEARQQWSSYSLYYPPATCDSV
jgi:hypothetical protein